MGPKILTVDDSKPIRDAVALAFEPYECEILEAADGLDGLAMVTRKKPDLVLLDCAMPVMDGLEMLSRLKSDAGTRAIPVIMLTAASGRENALRLARLGAVDLLPKPFHAAQVIERVRRLLPLSPRNPTPAEAACSRTNSAPDPKPPTA